MAALTNPIFTDPEAARLHLEALRWAKGRFCPHCGETERTSPTASKNHKPGLYYCLGCEKTFTVTVGTLFERSHVALNKWMLGFHLMAASKKGMSAHQLHRMLGVTYKTAWFMSHRIREAMADGDLSPFGSGGGPVEVDETFIGRKKGRKVRHGYEHKQKVLALVDRETGQARSMVLNTITTKSVAPIVRANVAKEARLMTDEAKHYTKVGREFADNQVVQHSTGEYGRGDAHTNTIEGFFSIFKRGMKGTYQHCSEKHLHRYLAEFDFRYNNRIALEIDDSMRAAKALQGIEGKRLTYRRANGR